MEARIGGRIGKTEDRKKGRKERSMDGYTDGRMEKRTDIWIDVGGIAEKYRFPNLWRAIAYFHLNVSDTFRPLTNVLQ